MSDIFSEGEDALIVACEDDHYVVVAGTFEKLVEQLACEEKPGTPPTYTCSEGVTMLVRWNLRELEALAGPSRSVLAALETPQHKSPRASNARM